MLEENPTDIAIALLQSAASPGAEGPPTPPGSVKTSTASITLKSATLPRRKINAKAEVQLDIKPPIPEPPAGHAIQH